MENKDGKTVFLGYRRAIGIMDIQGIVDYTKLNGSFEKVILVASIPLTEAVQNYLDKNLKILVPVDVIIVKNVTKKVREMDGWGDNIWAINLNEFGNRVMSSDAD